MNQDTNITEGQAEWKKWATFVGPLAAYMLLSSLVIAIWERIDIQLVTKESPSVAMSSVVIRLVSILAIFMWGVSQIKRHFPLQVSFLSVPIGILGAIIWVGLCRLNLETQLLSIIGLPADLLGEREATNPWDLFQSDRTLYLFLTLRLSLLIIAVPIAEELFLRGFLLRYLQDPNWDDLPLTSLGPSVIGVSAIYGILTHPSEWIAAALWFSLVSWLMLRTQRFWDCVVAHGITNGILGAYIIWAQDWRLW